MGALSGRHALITGGGTGIGAAIARRLAADGANVTITGRRAAPLTALAKELPRACAVVANVTQAADCRAMVTAAQAAFGPLDIVIVNAGGAESAAFSDLDADQWQRMLDVNLTGAYLTVQAAREDLVRAGDRDRSLRRLVFIASTAGIKGYPYVAAYVAAKHGVVGLMRALAAEYARTALTVNAICPGFTETPLLDVSIANIVAKTSRSQGDARDALARHNPQGRLIQPAEVADAVAWVCSPAAQSITGQAIAVSGGET